MRQAIRRPFGQRCRKVVVHNYSPLRSARFATGRKVRGGRRSRAIARRRYYLGPATRCRRGCGRSGCRGIERSIRLSPAGCCRRARARYPAQACCRGAGLRSSPATGPSAPRSARLRHVETALQAFGRTLLDQPAISAAPLPKHDLTSHPCPAGAKPQPVSVRGQAGDLRTHADILVEACTLVQDGRQVADGVQLSR